MRLMLTPLVESVGYIGRAWSSKQSPDFTLIPYIIQVILLLVAPTRFAASIYKFLGRIIEATGGESHSLIRQRWLTKIFVVGDFFSFLLQAAGMIMKSSAFNQADKNSLQVELPWPAKLHQR